MSFSIFFKNNWRNSHKNELRTFEARGDENFKNIELQQKKSGPYKKKVYALVTHVIIYNYYMGE